MQPSLLRLTDGPAEAEALLGTFALPKQARLVLRKSTRVLRPDGAVLCVLLKGALSAKAGRAMYAAVRERVAASNNRGVAAGSKRWRRVKKDGTLSNTNLAATVNSSVMGFFDRSPRFPYCRQTAFNFHHANAYAQCLPALREADALFAQHAPENYARQKQVAEKTHADFKIEGTTFTTVTLNKNFRTAYHRDAGDLPEGFGVMSYYRSGRFTGGDLVFPAWGVALALDSFDLVLFDPHEIHGNTEITPISAEYERITCVHYYRKNMRYCGSAAQELALAQNHDSRLHGARALRKDLAVKNA